MLPSDRRRFFIDADRTNPDKVRELLQKGKFLLVEQAGALAGCVYVELRGERGYFGLLAVDPGFQRSGLGSRLVAAAEEYCRAADCRFMDLTIVNLRTELPGFYHRLGYTESGTLSFPRDEQAQPAVPSGEDVEDPRLARVARAPLSVCQQRHRSSAQIEWDYSLSDCRAQYWNRPPCLHPDWWKESSAHNGFFSTVRRSSPRCGSSPANRLLETTATLRRRRVRLGLSRGYNQRDGWLA